MSRTSVAPQLVAFLVTIYFQPTLKTSGQIVTIKNSAGNQQNLKCLNHLMTRLQTSKVRLSSFTLQVIYFRNITSILQMLFRQLPSKDSFIAIVAYYTDCAHSASKDCLTFHSSTTKSMNHHGDPKVSSPQSKVIVSCYYLISLIFRKNIKRSRLALFRCLNCFSHHLPARQRMIDAFVIATLFKLNFQSCLKERCYLNSV